MHRLNNNGVRAKNSKAKRNFLNEIKISRSRLILKIKVDKNEKHSIDRIK